MAKDNLLRATSSRLTQLLTTCEDGVRGEYLQAEDVLVSTINEEWNAKFAFVDEYPVTFLKVMQPYFGGTIQGSKEHYQRALEWYDALPNKAVCPEGLAIFLRPGGLRSSGEEYIRSSERPLHDNWPLFKQLLVASAALLVERRLEGQHAIIASGGKQALTNVMLPPGVSAHLRRPQVVQALDEDLFWHVLTKSWLARETTWRALLGHCSSPAQLKSLTYIEKLEKLYMYDAKSGFEAEVDVKQCMSRWRRAVAALEPPKAAPLTESQSCLVDHFRSSLELGCVMCVPPLEDGDDEVAERACTTESIIGVLRAPPPPPPRPEDLAGAGIKYYEVVHLNPGARTVARSATGTRTPSSSITVREFVFAGHHDGGLVTLEPVAESLQLFDLLCWTTRRGFEHALRKVAVCRSAHVMTTLDCRPDQVAVADAVGEAGAPVLADAVEEAGAPSLALVPMDLHHDGLAVIAAMAKDHDNKIPTLTTLGRVPQSTVDALIRQGVLIHYEDEDFGDEVLSINWDKVVWKSKRALLEPAYLASHVEDVQNARQMSKLALCAALLEMGWEAQRSPAPLTDESEKRFSHRNLFRAKGYWVALLQSAELFRGKRAPQIPHDKPYAFYECLLHLSEEKLIAMFASPDYPNYKNTDFLRILKGDCTTNR